MNYALFADWVRERVEDLVEMGVPRAAAEQTMRYLEVSAINAETEARRDDQFLFQFANAGSEALAERLSITPHAVRARRRTILKKRTEAARQHLR
ncbi:MAG TPA: hypothetical protein VEY92_08510 [Pseudoxanthomonas sp.]|nr:hypothetical protein [Pseudoxanthomonas sp.]